jgi:uncharacterized protein YozE (UPF0346 family)
MKLKQVYKLISNFFEGHAQVKSYSQLDSFDFNSERQLDYIHTNVEFINSTIEIPTSSQPTGQLINYQFDVTIAGKAEYDDSVMEWNVISDCHEIANDFLIHLQLLDNVFINQTQQVTPFVNTNADRVCGVTFSIVLSVKRNQNECAIPTK